MRRALLIFTVLIFTGGCKYEPLKISRTRTSNTNGKTFKYMVENVAGWEVLVRDTMWMKWPRMTSETLEIVRHQLTEIARALPAHTVAMLRAVPIYVTNSRPENPSSAHFINSRTWLIDNAEDESMYQCIEIVSPKQFIRATRVQPCLMLHELAHAYQIRYFDFNENVELRTLYDNAMKSRKYQVLPYTHTLREHYASTNFKEYFAEASEAYWGRNDFYPFDREELKEYDPELFEFVQWVWLRKRD
jgi:hypothetical protein